MNLTNVNVENEINIVNPSTSVVLTPNKAPIISDDNYWMVWNTETLQYEKTDIWCKGVKGDTGSKGDTGDNCMTTFVIVNGELHLLKDTSATGADYYLGEDGCLHMTMGV